MRPNRSTPADRPLPRRAMLAASGTAVLAGAAACSSGSGTTAAASSGSPSSSARPSSAPAPAPSTSTAAPAAPAESSTSPAATTEPTDASAATPPGPVLASVADVESAGSVVVEAADGPLLLAFAEGTVVAHTAVCTHQQCTIAATGMCPCHGSRFNVTTGAVEQGPALRPLAQETVTVSDGQVYLG